MADVHHFAYGPINPVLAYVLSFLGCLLGLLLAGRARDASGLARARWLALAALALGGTGIWLMHFMAIIGFDVPESVVRYDPWITGLSAIMAVLIVALGLFTVGFGIPSLTKIVLGGFFTGVGVAAMHYTGMAATRVSGTVTYHSGLVGASLVISVIASTVALWFAVVIRGTGATMAAALLMGVAACSMHYTGMASVEVRLHVTDGAVPGMSPFELLGPIGFVACLVISALAYATVGLSMRQEGAREDAALERARHTHGSALLRIPAGAGRHR